MRLWDFIFNYQNDTAIRWGEILLPVPSHFEFQTLSPTFIAALYHIYNIEHFKVRWPSVESRKNCLPRDTQIFQFMSGRQHWCATAWFHCRNGHHNDSSRESKSWFQPQHSLFKHGPWSDVLCAGEEFIYLQCCFWRFSSCLNQYVSNTTAAVFWMCWRLRVPIRISCVWCHWVFLIHLHCCVFILRVGIKAKNWNRWKSVAVAESSCPVL